LIVGSMILIIALSGSGTAQAAPWWAGTTIIAISAVIGVWGVRSLLSSMARSLALQRVDDGLFELSPSSPSQLIIFNAAIAKHFGLSVVGAKQHMPGTFGELVASVTKQAAALATVKPAQYEAARAALASVLARRAQSISWSSRATDLLPSGKRRFETWERLREAAPSLPSVTLNRWVENVAFYGLFATLIAIAVPIARDFDENGATHIKPTALGHIVGHELGVYLFGLIIAVLMIPIYLIGRRYASRIPASFDSLDSLAAAFPDGTTTWTYDLVAAHLRDVARDILRLTPAQLRNETPLISTGRHRNQ